MKNVLLLLSSVLIFIGCSTNNNGTVTVVPIAPTNLTGSVISTSQVNLSWVDNATNEDGYKIERKSGSGSYAVVGSTGVNLTTFSDLGLTPNTTYTYRVYAYNSAGNSLQYSNEVTVTTQDNIPSWLTNGLVAYYPFNGNAGDSSGNGNHGTVNGATLTTDRFGDNNKAYFFDGNSKILVPHSNSLIVGDEMTISLWFQQYTMGNTINYILQKGTGGSCTNTGYYCAVDYDYGNVPNGVKTMSYGQNGNCSGIGNDTSLNSNWHIMTIVYNPMGENKIYIDGEFTTGNWSFCMNCRINNSLTPLIIGGFYSTQGCNNWNGNLDDIRIYNRALSQSEVTYLATH